MKLAGQTYLPDDDGIFAAAFRRGNVFEFPSLKTGLEYVKRFRRAVDGGAHVGSWSRYLAGLFDNVVAFEPHPANHECAQRNTAHLPNVFVFPYALGWDRGRASLQPGGNSGSWFIGEGNDIEIRKLDFFDFNDVDYLKLDVEGYEYFALRGARMTIERTRPVIQIEEKARFAKRYPEQPKAREWLESMGYREVARYNKDVVFVCE